MAPDPQTVLLFAPRGESRRAHPAGGLPRRVGIEDGAIAMARREVVGPEGGHRDAAARARQEAVLDPARHGFAPGQPADAGQGGDVPLEGASPAGKVAVDDARPGGARWRPVRSADRGGPNTTSKRADAYPGPLGRAVQGNPGAPDPDRDLRATAVRGRHRRAPRSGAGPIRRGGFGRPSAAPPAGAPRRRSGSASGAARPRAEAPAAEPPRYSRASTTRRQRRGSSVRPFSSPQSQ